MKNLLPKALFFYSAAASFFIAISTILTTQSGGPLIFATLFLPVVAYFVLEIFGNLRSILNPNFIPNPDTFPQVRTKDVLWASLFFLIFVGVGVKNVFFQPKPNPAPEIAETNGLVMPKAKETPMPNKTLTIKINDGVPEVNIRSKPSIYSEKLGTAKDGQIFEYTQKDGEWYEVIVSEGVFGYISFKYIDETKL